MGTFFAYSLQTAICLAIFYLFYKVLLSRETFHRFNRMALLGILALSFIIPLLMTFVSIPQGNVVDVVEPLEKKTSLLFADISVEAVLPEKENVLLSRMLLIYLTGCGIYLIYCMVSFYRILRIVTNAKSSKSEQNAKVIILNDTHITPFSWMKYIVLSKPDYDEAGQTIIAHEKAHIRLHHTGDLMLAQLCLLTQWFNPAAWLFYRELQNIHEYEADNEVIQHGLDTRQYQLLLIKKAVGARLFSMANSFNHSNLKKRITMMLQKKSNAWARLKYAYVLPLAATAVVVFAQPEISQQFEEISSAKITHFAFMASTNEVKNLPEADIFLLSSENTAALPAGETNSEKSLQVPETNQQPDYVYLTVEQMPKFPGGETALLKWISDNMSYPSTALFNGIYGRVACQFIVEKDGSVSNVEVIRGRDPDLDKEAIRVLQKLPKFEPGRQRGEVVRVKYQVPVSFKIQNKEEPETTPQETKSNEQKDNVFITVEEMPIFPGGETALLKWISNNMTYPQIALENGIQGRVSCQMTIEADGSVTDVEIIRGRDPSIDKEALRVLKMLPKFIPGKQRGQPVAVKYQIPVTFKITSTEKESEPVAQVEVEDVTEPKSSFFVYPNPVNDVLTIDVDQEAILAKYATAGKKAVTPIYEFRLYNISGVQVLHTTARYNKVQINVAKFPAGNYFLHISDGIEDKPEVKPVIIRH